MSAIERLGIKAEEFTKNKNYSSYQNQTKDTFGFKWSKRDTYESEAVKANARKWLFGRYCNNKPERLDELLSGGRKIILDAGCGSGFSAMLFFGEHIKSHDYLGIDISDAAAMAKERFREAGYPGDFIVMNLLDLPISDGTVDIIFSEGVLHHTDSTEQSVKFLARKLKRGGRFLFYVYAKKAIIREFTDDHIRCHLQTLNDKEAWKALESITRLGVSLGEIDIEFEVPEDIEVLGIKKGKYDLQRFFYWNICKMYYRPEFSFDEMNHVNFDWFRPLNCHRHTPEEIKKWCREAELTVDHMNVQEAGITVVAVKQ